jgi:two-component system sensor histidine kinase PilS (NtrC family)
MSLFAATIELPAGSDMLPTKLFRVFSHYRVVIGLLMLGSLFIEMKGFNNYRFALLYQVGVVAYLALNLFISFLLLAGLKPNTKHLSLSMMIDIFLLHALMYCNEGISSGLANLVVISVAAGNILVQGRLGTLLAATAALLSLGIEIQPVLYRGAGVQGVVQSGLLGIIYFATAFILQNIARRISSSDQLAHRRAKNIAQLEKLNHQIIQRMLTGIIVTDEFGNIRLMNQAAANLAFASGTRPEGRNQLPDELRERFDRWVFDSDTRSPPFRPDASRPAVQANFTQLEKDHGHDILIFLEDTSKVAHQAQQMKLASLGRLTAGIAHEIRNPLGAISHASQLLAESELLDAADRKMTDIILRHARRMNGIIENVLQLSRRKQPEAQLLDLYPWIQEFITTYTAEGGIQAHINIESAAEEIQARFDPSQLEQVLANLFDNGLRYSKEGAGMSALKLRIGVNEISKRAYVDIIDFGKGIDEKNLQHIFEPFFTTNRTGTGLGLYLCRELCEANQAQLDYIKSKHESCFRITFAHYKKIS